MAGAVFSEGDVVTPKIANVKLFAQPGDGGNAIATLTRGEDLVVIGGEQNGYLNVQGDSGAGWVRKVLLSRR